MLPLHKEVWRSTHTPGAVEITFKDTDPVITLYRWLRTQENLEGIWHRERKAVTLNGWSLLHRAVPWYDESQGRARRLDESGAWASEHVSHIVTSDSKMVAEGVRRGEADRAIQSAPAPAECGQTGAEVESLPAEHGGLVA